MIVVDAYRQPYIPFYLSTREFFAEVREKLAPGGAVVVNVGHPEGNDDLEKVLGRDDGGRVPDRPARPGRGHQHAAARQRRADASAERLLAAVGDLPEDLRNLARGRFRAASSPRLPGGEVYTDDRAPVEWLIDRSILGYAGGDG